jgi:RPA family protein
MNSTLVTPPPAPPTDAKPAPRTPREVAHRVFALEFNASRAEIKGQGEKDPSFLVTPLGAKVNRLHIVGVCTDVEPVGESGEVWRARISDPTGVFTVYAGQYQPEAAQALSQLQPPQFVAITGKARTYEPEPGSVFVSVRPESVTVVDEATRNQWILDTARRTAERYDATKRLRADPKATLEQMVAAGVPKQAASGALIAQQHYGLTDVDRFAATARTALGYLVGQTEVPVHRIEARAEAGAMAAAATAPGPAPAPPAAAAAQATAAQDALDDSVLASVGKLEGAKGARWDDILSATAKDGVTAEDVEEALNRLMDKGLVYEPTLGILKTT